MSSIIFVCVYICFILAESISLDMESSRERETLCFVYMGSTIADGVRRRFFHSA